VRQRGK